MARPRQLFVPPIVLDRTAASPLHRQISRQVEHAIHNGLADGVRLPSTRVLARLLGVSRNTVLTAYDELVSGGLITGRRGAAMLVTTRRAAGAPDVYRLLREAQFPARTVSISDPDGAVIELNYSR